MFQQATTGSSVARAKRFHVAVTAHHASLRRFVCCFYLLTGSVGLLPLDAQELSLATEVNCFGFTGSDPTGLRHRLRYTASHSTLTSAHRGGAQLGFPENCIATFEHSLHQGCTMLEVDPRLTKDGKIVLHHDSTLDRTTSGSGPLKQKTLEGNPTKHQIPTLEETIQWSRGKTVLVLDQKDVPLQQRIDVITKHHAEGFVMLIVGSPTGQRQFGRAVLPLATVFAEGTVANGQNG